jgi:hypothetical protein
MGLSTSTVEQSMRLLFVLLLLPATILAQQNSAFGTVSGHVYCSDTQQPARLGQIRLLSIPDTLAAGPAAKKEPSVPRNISAKIGLDGSFLFPHVPPGNYYVVADRPGYIAPEAQFTDAEIESLASEMRERIAKSVPTILVVENKTTTIDVHLHRGAAISGILRYDDGSPVPMNQVDILRRDKSGQWVLLDTEMSEMSALTDDLGHFRISGLSTGEYILNSSCDSSGTWELFGTEKILSIYSGDVFFQKDAKPIKIGEGEESTGNNITIPLSKIHSISGSLLNVAGHIINAGEIALYTMPDNSKIAHAQVEPENLSFHLDFVPEGHYVLRVTNARDVTRQTIQPPPGSSDEPKYVETTVQEYGPYESPFEVVGDMTTVNLVIPPKAK